MPKKRPRKARGRPRSLADTRVRSKVLSILRTGGSRSDAALHAGVSHDTIGREAGRDPQFDQDLQLAESAGKIRMLELVWEGAKVDWRAAAWLLERKHWKEFAKRGPDQVTPEQVVAMTGQVIASILIEVPAEFHGQVHAKIANILGTAEAGNA